MAIRGRQNRSWLVQRTGARLLVESPDLLVLASGCPDLLKSWESPDLLASVSQQQRSCEIRQTYCLGLHYVRSRTMQLICRRSDQSPIDEIGPNALDRHENSRWGHSQTRLPPFPFQSAHTIMGSCILNTPPLNSWSRLVKCHMSRDCRAPCGRIPDADQLLSS